MRIINLWNVKCISIFIFIIFIKTENLLCSKMYVSITFSLVPTIKKILGLPFILYNILFKEIDPYQWPFRPKSQNKVFFIFYWYVLGLCSGFIIISRYLFSKIKICFLSAKFAIIIIKGYFPPTKAFFPPFIRILIM